MDHLTSPPPAPRSRSDLDDDMGKVKERLLEAAVKIGTDLFIEKYQATEDGVAAVKRLEIGAFFILGEGLLLRKPKTTNPDPHPEIDDAKPTVSDDKTKAAKNDGLDDKAIHSTGLYILFESVREIETQLRTASIANIAKQLLISLGFLLIAGLVKAWAQCLVVILTPWRLFGKQGQLWKRPVHIFYSIQFLAGVWALLAGVWALLAGVWALLAGVWALLAGVWALLAATTFLSEYRNWENTGGYGATWPLMAFLLVLQPTQEATIQKAILRAIGTCLGALIAWGVVSLSTASGFLVPISTLIVGICFWFNPDARSQYLFSDFGDVSYVCVAFTFAYTTVTIFSYSYGAFPTFITRLVSQ